MSGETGFVARTGNTPIGYYNDPVKTAETFVTIDGTLWAVSLAMPGGSIRTA
jgi:hypothetical protein